MAGRLALFLDRRDAGRRLAEIPDRFTGEEPLVVALPRGGVPVGFEIAKALVAPLDILLIRKLGAPFNPEYGIGAIAEGGVRFIRRAEVELIGVSDEELDEVVARESAELERRKRLYREHRRDKTSPGAAETEGDLCPLSERPYRTASEIAQPGAETERDLACGTSGGARQALRFRRRVATAARVASPWGACQASGISPTKRAGNCVGLRFCSLGVAFELAPAMCRADPQ